MKARFFLGFILSVMLLIDAVGVNAGQAANAPWFISTVDSVPGGVSHVSVAIDPNSDTTYISYYDSGNDDLKMAKHVGSGGNCGPDNDWSCETVDSSGNVGLYSSIAIDPTTNLPVIAYRDTTNGLKLAIAWSGGWDIIMVDSIYGYASLKIDSTGAAHIAYSSSNNLKYAKRVGSGGNCGGNNYQCDTINSCSGSCIYPSLALDGSGQPRIAYYETDDDDLWYAQPGSPGNCGPGNSWGCYQIDTASDVGRYLSLDVDSSNISHVAYYDATNGKLRYAVFVGLGGNCGFLSSWQCDEIATMGTTPHTRDVSLAVDKAGFPIIAYRNYHFNGIGTASFRWARPVAALGQQSGNCGPQNLWQCEGILDGFYSGDYSAIAVHSSGLATIAYNYSKFIFSSQLRVAYQQFDQFPWSMFLPAIIGNPK